MVEKKSGVISDWINDNRRWRAGGDHAIEKNSTTDATPLFVGDHEIGVVLCKAANGILGRARTISTKLAVPYGSRVRPSLSKCSTPSCLRARW